VPRLRRGLLQKDSLAVLRDLRRVLEEGKAARKVQTTPHLVVLSRPYYDAQLRPVLSRWMLLWLFAHGCNGLPTLDVLEYLDKGPGSPAAKGPLHPPAPTHPPTHLLIYTPTLLIYPPTHIHTYAHIRIHKGLFMLNECFLSFFEILRDARVERWPRRPSRTIT